MCFEIGGYIASVAALVATVGLFSIILQILGMFFKMYQLHFHNFAFLVMHCSQWVETLSRNGTVSSKIEGWLKIDLMQISKYAKVKVFAMQNC